MSDEKESPEKDVARPLKPDNVLDSIFSEGGPMPTAKFSMRGLAFLLDIILMTAIASIIIWKIAMPYFHPGAFGELLQWSEKVVLWLETQNTEATFPEPSKGLTRALTLANELQLLVFWIYFAVGEAFFAGSSLGKKICRIRSISTVTLGPPQILPGIIRGGLKTVTLFWLFPVALMATFLALFFNKRRQLAHDLCARTTVIDEKFVNLQPKR